MDENELKGKRRRRLRKLSSSLHPWFPHEYNKYLSPFRKLLFTTSYGCSPSTDDEDEVKREYVYSKKELFHCDNCHCHPLLHFSALTDEVK
ncbi:CLUMA_CG012282, isoform A [Clunio marinus]|uniref:CLUMA_CG012282, isoform A n=1 Tax=Clunio marinus TaxID=568069 RepID=A0A1J1IJP1_9DIPT|nr:CLUMA_CG012282, isoform A [Clunio marinus]